MAMNTSSKGRAFIRAHEGNPLTCYLDPIGVPTIGPGLTNRSAVVTAMLGKLVPGKSRITNAQGDRVFAAVLDQEVEPAIERGMPGAKQHEFDAGSSGGYNLGADRFMGWKWADLWRAGRKREAAQYLSSHYNTAGGKKLPGLVRRRKEEALLLEKGIYTGIETAEGIPRTATEERTGPDPVVKEAQEILSAKGFNPGAIDGWMGEKTRAAIIAYQEAHPHLVVDGILGPATLAQLRRDAQALGDMVKETATKGGGGAIGSGLLAFFAGLPWQWIIPGVVLVALAWALWTHRDVLQRRWNSLTGRKVVV